MKILPLMCLIFEFLSEVNSFIFDDSHYGFKTKPRARTMYRDDVEPDMGGKVPEAYYNRQEWNEVDAQGLSDEETKLKAKILKNKQLHQTAVQEATAGIEKPFLGAPASFNFPSGQFPSFENELKEFDSQKLSPNSRIPKQFNDLPNYGNIDQEKPHLFTPDPYLDGDAVTDGEKKKFSPPPVGYSPPVGPYEEAPYKPEQFSHLGGYFDEEPLLDDYHAPYDEYQAPHDEYNAPHDEYIAPHDEYNAPHDEYIAPHDEYNAPHDDYRTPHDDYAPPPYVPKEPVLLEKRPYEVTEIRAPPVVTYDSYTKFDCRNVPFPDRHYADTDAGCEVYPLLPW